jgi:hypothetical protein
MAQVIRFHQTGGPEVLQVDESTSAAGNLQRDEPVVITAASSERGYRKSCMPSRPGGLGPS